MYAAPTLWNKLSQDIRMLNFVRFKSSIKTELYLNFILKLNLYVGFHYYMLLFDIMSYYFCICNLLIVFFFLLDYFMLSCGLCVAY